MNIPKDQCEHKVNQQYRKVNSNNFIISQHKLFTAEIARAFFGPAISQTYKKDVTIIGDVKSD